MLCGSGSGGSEEGLESREKSKWWGEGEEDRREERDSVCGGGREEVVEIGPCKEIRVARDIDSSTRKKRHFGPEKDKVYDEQVRDLQQAGHIREIQFLTWLSNVVLVPKATEKWKMCVDFRYLNKACTKDHYPLPRIDQLMDSTFGYELLSFMDAYQEYNQIPLAKNDQDKDSFITSGGTIFYVVMPFRLKNAKVTYQRLMNKVLRKAQKFGWDEKFEQAFQDLKSHLAELPVLVKPEPGEKLFVYLSTKEYAVSSVLVKEESSDQKTIYYVSHALRGLELRYSEVEKIALTLVMTARRLRPYFLSHQIIVLTNSPLRRIMTHSKVFGKMIKCSVELGEYDVEYKAHATIKAQALSDLLSEMVKPDEEQVWRVFVDGASSLSGCGVGVVIIALPGEKIKLALRIDSRVTNNEAEYETVLAGIRAAREIGASLIILYSDLQLITQQKKGLYKAKDDMMLKYLQIIKAHAKFFVD
ncbi:uncharacterized protein [Primulina eburnea]|uniref:uncharacterized protein n=1 Tax=Primulina eburnea TaxID=1245227 RepID=UPI003C6C2E9A